MTDEGISEALTGDLRALATSDCAEDDGTDGTKRRGSIFSDG